jgi:hypothetical protein
MRPQPRVMRKLYIASPDMEEIIEANLRLQAADYGFEIVANRSDADVVLQGSAGVLNKDSPSACVPFYGFDVLRQEKGRPNVAFKLESRISNDIPCIRLSVAKNILYGLREQLDALDAHSATHEGKRGDHCKLTLTTSQVICKIHFGLPRRRFESKRQPCVMASRVD